MTCPINKALLSCLTRYGVANETVLVAVSGGIDSVSLAHALAHASAAVNISLCLVHVNHKLREHHSDSDATFVIELAAELGCNVRVIDAPTLEHPNLTEIGIEAAARMQRYDALMLVAHELGARTVMTAHTLSDNVETFIMNAARGSGYKGLSAIPESRRLDDSCTVLRPLLDCTRSQINDYARGKGLAWRNDHTNDVDEYTRNRVRHRVLPAIIEALGDSALRGIHTSATYMTHVRGALDVILAPYASIIHYDEASHEARIDADLLRSTPAELRLLLLLHCLPLSSDDAVRMLDLLEAETGTKASLSHGRMAVRERAFVTIGSTPSIHEFSTTVEPSGTYEEQNAVLEIEQIAIPIQGDYTDDVVFFDLTQIHPPLTWRTWVDGDRIAPFGMDGKSALVSDVITNARVPHQMRRNMQVLTDTRGILWICGLRRSNRAPITEETAHVLRCCYRTSSI